MFTPRSDELARFQANGNPQFKDLRNGPVRALTWWRTSRPVGASGSNEISTELFAGFALLVLAAGVTWQYQNARLASRLFGSEYRVRYVHQRWVVEGTVDGYPVKYTTGGLGWLPALSYLFIQAPVREVFSVTRREVGGTLPKHVGSEIAALRQSEGFRRLDAFVAGSLATNSLGRVSWLHPGDGILLRRYSKAGGNPLAIKRDIAALKRIAASTST